MLVDEVVESLAAVDEPAEDRLAALIRDALVSAYGEAEPPAAAWPRIRQAIDTRGAACGENATVRRSREAANRGCDQPNRRLMKGCTT